MHLLPKGRRPACRDERARPLGVAAGILHPGETIDFNPGMLRGKQVIVRVVPQKNSDYNEVDDRGYAVWLIGDEEVASVPKLTLPKPFESDN